MDIVTWTVHITLLNMNGMVVIAVKLLASKQFMTADPFNATILPLLNAMLPRARLGVKHYRPTIKMDQQVSDCLFH